MKVSLTILLVMFIFGGAVSSHYPGEAFAQTRRRSPQKKVIRYACPMHPEFISSSPGKCPKCGMTLRAVKSEQLDKTSASEITSNEPTATQTDPAVSLRIPDTVVYDQNGKRLKFYTNLIKGKTVAINFIFTTCTSICPPLTATFRRVQQQLGERNDVQLISVSVDPTIDVPERLKEYADKFKAGPGWTFVTGDKIEIDSLLRALGAAVANKNDHTPTILIGSDSAGYWTRAYGLSPPSRLVEIIRDTASRKSIASRTADRN
jgi:protein SCO1